MFIQKSKDGRFVAGYINYRDDKKVLAEEQEPIEEEIPKEPTKEPTKSQPSKEKKYEDVILSIPEVPRQSWEEAVRNIERWVYVDNVKKAEKAQEKADELQKEIDTLFKRRIRLKKWRHFFKNTIGEHMLVYGLIGLFTGIIIGIDTILTWHGPTVTFVGTLLAIVIYLGMGLFYGGAFAFFARFFNMQAVEDISKIIDTISEEISDNTSKYFEKLEEQKHFQELASEENLL